MGKPKEMKDPDYVSVEQGDPRGVQRKLLLS
jgi:hypothetical protein